MWHMAGVKKYKVTNMDNDRKNWVASQQHECMEPAAITVALLLAHHLPSFLPCCLLLPLASLTPKTYLLTCSRDPIFSPSLSIALNLQSLFFTVIVPPAVDLFHFFKIVSCPWSSSSYYCSRICLESSFFFFFCILYLICQQIVSFVLNMYKNPTTYHLCHPYNLKSNYLIKGKSYFIWLLE